MDTRNRKKVAAKFNTLKQMITSAEKKVGNTCFGLFIQDTERIKPSIEKYYSLSIKRGEKIKVFKAALEFGHPLVNVLTAITHIM